MKWLRSLTRARRTTPLAHPQRRLALEALEDRCLPVIGTLNVNQSFILTLYRDVLGRDAGATELTSKEDALFKAGVQKGVVRPTEFSTEAARRTVSGWFKTYLGRDQKANEGQGLIMSLVQGVSEETTLNSIFASDEYFNTAAPKLIGAPASNVTFLRALYRQLLNREPSNDEITIYPPKVSRTGTPISILVSPERRTLVVQFYYASILHRSIPFTSPEVVNFVNSNLDVRNIRVQLESSEEYFYFTSPNGITSPVTGLSEISIPRAASGGPQIVAGADGNMWYTEPSEGKIGRIRPDNTVTEFNVSFGVPPASGITNFPVDITAGIDGSLWFTAPQLNRIGRITLGGDVVSIDIPTGNSIPRSIVAGLDGGLWFTEEAGNRIGRVGLDGSFIEFAVPTPNSGPSGITVGPDGNFWFTEATANKIGLLTLQGAFAEFPIPTPNTGAFDITTGGDGVLWFTERNVNRIGRILPNGTFGPEIFLPAGGAPEQIITATDGNVWFTRLGNVLGRLTPAGVETEFTTPSSALVRGLASGPDGRIWFTEENSAKAGFVQGVPDTNRSFVLTQFRNILARVPAATEIKGWVSQLLLAGQKSVTDGILRSLENLIRPITRLYADTLHRLPSQSEQNAQLAVLQKQGRAALANAIERSAEAHAQLARSWYFTYLDRAALSGEEQGLINFLNMGAAENDVLSLLLASDEYFAKAFVIAGGTPQTNDAYVSALYKQLLGRGPRADELDFWSSQVQVLGRRGVALSLLNSEERSRHLVTGYFATILQRGTAPTQKDIDGWAIPVKDPLLIRIGLESTNEFYRTP